MDTYGQNRISDTIAEFSSQCPQVGELIQAFSQQKEEYATDELLTLITRRALQAMLPTINGKPAHGALEVAHFLYQIDFITAKRKITDDRGKKIIDDQGNEKYEHLAYANKPQLLKSRTNIDDGVRWEISPAFRQALLLRDSTGRILRRPPKDLRGR